MKKLLIILFLFISLSLSATDYYVSTTGSDSWDGLAPAYVSGTNGPWATWQKAVDVAVAGDTVYFRGGIWYPTSHAHGTSATVIIRPSDSYGVSGTAANPIVYMAYPGEVPILDGSLMVRNGAFNMGIGMEGAQYIQFKGLTIRHFKQYQEGDEAYGFSTLQAANLRFENCVVHDIMGRGFYYSSGAWIEAYNDGYTETIPPFPTSVDTTHWINCDAYNLCDSLSENPGNSADGWLAIDYKGNALSWEGCRAWYFSDDGFDVNPGGGKMTFSNCWAMSTEKYLEYGIEGDGWKPNAHGWVYDPSINNDTLVTVTNCLAVYCYGVGFYGNLNGTYENNGVYYNNTAYRCGIGFFDVDAEGDADHSSTFKNNISVYSTSSGYGHPGGDDPLYEVAIYNPAVYTESNNNWDPTGPAQNWPGWVYADDITITDADFVSVDSSQIHAARQADGSLPDITFLTLIAGSDAIDYGTDVGLAFNGVAPDIGYTESGTADLTATDITSFTFPFQVGVSVINATTHTVTAVLQADKDISAITPAIGLSAGATSDPVSGVEDDYTNPVIITVTAEDAITEQEWTVTITIDDDPVPTVATVATTSASAKSIQAVVYGNLYSLNGGTFVNKGICISTSASPTVSDPLVYAGVGLGSFSSTLRGLTPSTTYHCRAFATTSEGGASYGDNVSFTTPKYSTSSSGGKVLMYNGKIVIIQ
jgi:hypothetical protein